MRKIWKFVLLFFVIAVIGVFAWINGYENTEMSESSNHSESEILEESSTQEERETQTELTNPVIIEQKEGNLESQNEVEKIVSDEQEEKMETEADVEHSEEAISSQISETVENTEDLIGAETSSEDLTEDNEMEIPWEWIE